MGLGRHRASFSLFFSLFFLTAGCGPPLTPRSIVIGGDDFQIANGVVGLFHFDEGQSGTAPGGKDFTDDSGYGHHGTKIGTLNWIPGSKNLAISSDGTGAISIPIDLSSTKTVTISIMFWTHITGSNDHNILFEYTADSQSQADGFAATFDDNTSPAHGLAFYMSGMFGQYLSSPTEQMHNLIVIYDRTNATANTITTYIDGASVTNASYPGMSASNGGNFANSTLYLLCRGGTTWCLKADIDELIIWDRALSSDEVNTLTHF